ncbi:MAG: AAA family ATPase [bacterium]
MDTNAFTFSSQQRQAIDAVQKWLASGVTRKPCFRLFGYAGTGKTMLARHLAAEIDGEVVYAAFTGKAALMMQKSGCQGASTIHKLIYRVEQLPDGGSRFVLNRKSAAATASLIVIDECSMVDIRMAEHLMCFGVPILVLGDPAQVPPMTGPGYFVDGEADVLLTEIHRQARDSGIIELSMAIREAKSFSHKTYDDVRLISSDLELEKAMLAADQVLAGRNKTVTALNKEIRVMKGFTGSIPNVGERLISYQNDSDNELLNGEQVEVVSVGETNDDATICTLTVRSLDVIEREAFEVEVLISGLEDGPDKAGLRWCRENSIAALRFAYAITVHKAQGSQWPNVLVFNESHWFRDRQSEWLYTAVTRASERVTIFPHL